jgi:hypothetical protein
MKGAGMWEERKGRRGAVTGTERGRARGRTDRKDRERARKDRERPREGGEGQRTISM